MASGSTGLLEEVKKKTKLFMNDRKHANELIDILSHTQAEDAGLAVAAVKALCRIFCKLIKNKQLYMESPSKEADLNPEENYTMWLRERYRDTILGLTQMLVHENSSLQEIALSTLMKYIECEGNHPLRKTPEGRIFFPISMFEEMIFVLLNEEKDMQSLLVGFQEYLQKDDVRFYSMKYTLKILKQKEGTATTTVFEENTLAMLENLSMPRGTEQQLSNYLTHIPEGADKVKFKLVLLAEHKKLFTTVWLKFLQRQLSTSVYKRVLLGLPDKVLPHMTSPLLLADFLTTSYNIGGVISLLALNGLFILINTHNLNYPDFYNKLFRLLEPSIFFVKYRARFFFLIDLFLTSTHLPAYLVAAFAKKLSRISLAAPPDGLAVSIPLVYNMVNRHATCQAMLHRQTPAEFASDPFNMEEEDPVKCGAEESSLWELKTLQEHYYHKVATETRKIDHPLPNSEMDLSSVLESTIDGLITKELKTKILEEEDVPMNFEPPKALFNSKEDQFHGFWCL